MPIANYFLAAFAVVFGGAVLGMLIGRLLPEKYHSDGTQKIVQTATSMVSLLAALVLGLLVASAKGKFDSTNAQTEEYAAKLMLIHHELARIGPEADDARALLRKYTIAKIAENWPGRAGPKPQPGDPPPWQLLESVQEKLSELGPRTDFLRAESAGASQAAAELTKTTWIEAARESAHVQHPFVIMLVLWIFVLFISYGLFAPRNLLVASALLVGALAIAVAIGMIVDLDTPFDGFILVSPAPMLAALAQMQAP